MKLEHQGLEYEIPQKLLCKNHRKVKILILSSDYPTSMKARGKHNQDQYADCVQQIKSTYGTNKAYEETGYKILECKKIIANYNQQPYISKTQVQNQVQQFLQKDEAQVCMLFLFGHGKFINGRTYYHWYSNGHIQVFWLDDFIKYWNIQKIRRLIIIFQGCQSGDWHQQIQKMPKGSINIITSCQKGEQSRIHYHKLSLQTGESENIPVEKRQYQMGLTTLAFYLTYKMQQNTYHPNLTKNIFDNSIYKRNQQAHIQYDLNKATLKFFKNTSLNFSCLDQNYEELQPFPSNNLFNTTSLYQGGDRKTSIRHKGVILKKIRKKHFIYQGFFKRSTFHGYGRYSTFKKKKDFNVYSQYKRKKKKQKQIFDNSVVDDQVLITSNQYKENKNQFWTFIQKCKFSLPQSSKMEKSGWQFSLRLNRTQYGTIYYSLTLYDRGSDFKNLLFRLNIFNKKRKSFGAYLGGKYKANTQRRTQHKPKLYFQNIKYIWVEHDELNQIIKSFIEASQFFSCEVYTLSNVKAQNSQGKCADWVKVHHIRYKNRQRFIFKKFDFNMHNNFGKGNFLQRALPSGVQFIFCSISFMDRLMLNYYTYYVQPQAQNKFINFERS